MNSVFRPKHQKLILQCYPSTKLNTAETKPNQAELSYLVYYASSRRTKLEKVGEFLLKKTAADISRKRVGHLKVTLYILQELITKCSEDLGFMTPYVLSIIRDIISLNELSSCQLSNTVFITYCETLQPMQRQVFSSNVDLLNNFLSIISKFLDFASNNHNNSDWLRISLKTSLIVADYLEASYSQFGKFDLIGKAIHLILNTLSSNQADLSLVKVSSIKSAEKSDSEYSMNDLALHALKSFFDTNSKNQLDISTINIISYFIENNKDLLWANKVAIICTKKTHIELRHRIMIILSNEIGKYVKANKIDILDYLLKIVSNLLGADDVQFVGFPIMDILNKIIEFEQQMIIHNEAHILKDSYSDLIRSLAGRIYYNNQINDMITGIFSYYYTTYNKMDTSTSDLNKLSEEQFLHYSQIIIDNIHDIFTVSDKSIAKLKKSAYPVTLFNYLYLVLPLNNLPNVRQQIQVMWLKMLNTFYKVNVENLSKPNNELCITNNIDNNLCLFFESLSRILDHNPRDELKAQMAVTISTMVNAFKLNFLMNYLKFSSVWLKNPEDFRYSLSLLILGLSSSQIEDGHELAALADSKIAYAQEQKLWPEYIGYKPLSNPSVSVLTHEALLTTLNNIPSVSHWMDKININQPLPVFFKQPMKQQGSMLLMSANNSLLSLPSPKPTNFLNAASIKSIPRNINHSHSLSRPIISVSSSGSGTMNGTRGSLDGNGFADIDSNFNDGDVSGINSTLDYTDSSINFVPPSGEHSFRSAWSIRSGRSKRVNLTELKQVKPDAINGIDLERLVKTRTGTTLTTLNTSGNGSESNTGAIKSASAGNSRGRSGLAFALSGLNLDDI